MKKINMSVLFLYAKVLSKVVDYYIYGLVIFGTE